MHCSHRYAVLCALWLFVLSYFMLIRIGLLHGGFVHRGIVCIFFLYFPHVAGVIVRMVLPS